MFAFLPVTLIIYFLLRSRSARNLWLLVVSLCFYAWGEPVYVLLMIASILVNWGIAIGLGAQREGEERSSLRRRAMLAVAGAKKRSFERTLAKEDYDTVVFVAHARDLGTAMHNSRRYFH